MKIAIFSDTHDNLVTLERALAWIAKEKIEVIIHCGDLASPETLEFILSKFSGRINIALGNVDNPRLVSPDRAKIHKTYGEIELDDKKIAFTHFPEKALELAKKLTFDLIFYGHTHRPWEEKNGRVRLANPGNLAGMFYKATFATYDTATDRLELKILENLI